MLKSYDVAYATAAKEFLLKHYQRNISAFDIANQIGVGELKLKRVFKQVYKMGIYECQLQIRMEKAKELLESGNHTVQQVARLVGYKRHSSFTKRFTLYYGISPSLFEKMN